MPVTRRTTTRISSLDRSGQQNPLRDVVRVVPEGARDRVRTSSNTNSIETPIPLVSSLPTANKSSLATYGIAAIAFGVLVFMGKKFKTKLAIKKAKKSKK